MDPQLDTAQRRAEAIASKANECCYRMDGYEEAIEAMVLDALQQARRAALLEVRQFCVDYEDCCVLGLVAHADKAVTNASISTMQFIKRHIDDRLAQEG